MYISSLTKGRIHNMAVLGLFFLLTYFSFFLSNASTTKSFISFKMERKHNFEFVGRSHHVIFVRDLQRHRFLHHVPTFKDFSTIKYQNDGVFYTYITLGGVEGKQQTFSAILDTGSRTIAIPCKNCNDRCGSEHNQYDISLSPTAKIVDEHGYSQCYAK